MTDLKLLFEIGKNELEFYDSVDTFSLHFNKNLYILTDNHIDDRFFIQVFDMTGKFKFKTKLFSSKDKLTTYEPLNICFSPNGDIYAFYSFYNCIGAFNQNYELQFEFGSKGSGPGQFNLRCNLCFGPNQSLYVLDTYNDRFQVFNDKGIFKYDFKLSKQPIDTDMKLYLNFCFGPNDLLYVCDCRSCCIQVYDVKGNFKFQFGSFGPKKGHFNTPNGLCFGPDDLLYVCDFNNLRIQVFDVNGNFQYEIKHDHIKHPYEIAFGPNNLIYVRNGHKLYHHKVQVLQHLKHQSLYQILAFSLFETKNNKKRKFY